MEDGEQLGGRAVGNGEELRQNEIDRAYGAQVKWRTLGTRGILCDGRDERKKDLCDRTQERNGGGVR